MKKYKPTSPGIRWKISIGNKNEKYKKIKNLMKIKKSTGGRNNLGRITTRHRGGGKKRKIRKIDFIRGRYNIKSHISRIEYDPNRNSLISLLKYSDGKKEYILYTKGMKVGDKVVSGYNLKPINGFSMMLSDIPIGTKICCIELNPGKGAKLIRSAGGFAKLISNIKGYSLVKLSSGEIRKINSNCFATIGEIGNENFYLKKIGKAGTKRKMGIRPTVRGVAMNPVDHPHGGGEGKTSTKGDPVSIWGKKTKGFKTRRNKRTNKFIIKKR
ncbi:LSU ribosomal protein L2p (L8e) [Candidatus Vidania fulgoroideae]|nr:LSU ribosomal protein L2p (L8e) [Candidatus Vidania fulgoroideae]